MLKCSNNFKQSRFSPAGLFAQTDFGSYKLTRITSGTISFTHSLKSVEMGRLLQFRWNCLDFLRGHIELPIRITAPFITGINNLARKYSPFHVTPFA